MKTTIAWLYRVIGKHRINIFILLFFHIALGTSGVFFALFMKSTLDAGVDGRQEVFYHSLLLLICFVAAQILLRALTRHLEEETRSSIENALKSRLFSCLLRKEYVSVTAIHSGDWMERLTSDSAIAAGGIVEILPHAAGMLVQLVSALALILILEPRFAFLILPGGILVIVLTYAFRKTLKQLHKNIQEADGRLRIFLQERLNCLMMIRSFAAEKFTEQQGNEKMNEHKQARMKRNRFSNLCNIGFSGAMNGLYLLGFAYCGYGIMQGNIRYGTLIAILQLISQIQSPFANLTGYLPGFYAMTASAERLMEAESYSDTVFLCRQTATAIQQFYQDELESLNLKDVTFSYPGNDVLPVLTHVNLTVTKGNYIALTGHSGCGKSTLLKLLLCLYTPSDGKLYIQKKNGETIPLTSSMHRLFAYVPQGNQLMNGSIREIISFGKQATDETIIHALKIACADKFVKELTHGIDTLLGERGAGLSEGQMQRIAIARAIYADCPILLFDEATSALDEQTEQCILKNIQKMTDKTVLIVTHRKAALSICDTIYEVTDNGIKRKESAPYEAICL